MSKENTNVASSPAEREKALKWFEHARNVADKHNYDYAIECYVNGLAIWPDAVDEGHKPLRAVAFARLGAGGKKPGMFEKMKFKPAVARDPVEGVVTAEKMLARDPNNLDYLEGLLRNAHKAGLEQTCLWLGPLFLTEATSNPKAGPAKLPLIRQIYEDLADQFNARGDAASAITCYDLAIKAVEILLRIKPDDPVVVDQLRNLSGKATIAKGNFEAGDFRESLRDADMQRQLYDKDRMVADSEQMAGVIDHARKDMASAPDEVGKVFSVVELLLRRGRPQDEEEAIHLLEQTYQRNRNYQFKMRADDIRMRQMCRQGKQIAANGDKQAANDFLRKHLEFEIGIFRERIRQYPTESRPKFELGKRYFQMRRFDEAVPVLQQARNDPKIRTACSLLIGRCFFYKDYHDQAINLLQEALKAYELQGDDLSKELTYWLARSYEASGQKDPAIQAYGQIIQWDYNYLDVRQRLETLQQARKTEAGQ